jgi:hypothetical protein
MVHHLIGELGRPRRPGLGRQEPGQASGGCGGYAGADEVCAISAPVLAALDELELLAGPRVEGARDPDPFRISHILGIGWQVTMRLNRPSKGLTTS